MKKVNTPKKGAGRRLAQKLQEQAKQKPPKDLIERLIIPPEEDNKKVALPNQRANQPEL